jgi:hypothetical protein
MIPKKRTPRLLGAVSWVNFWKRVTRVGYNSLAEQGWQVEGWP